MFVILLKAQYCYSTGQVCSMSASSTSYIIVLFLSTMGVFLFVLLLPTFPLSCLTTCQVDLGVPYLCEALKEANEQRQSKSWYLLRARTLQTCSSYLSLDTAALPQAQRGRITQHGELKHLLHLI